MRFLQGEALRRDRDPLSDAHQPLAPRLRGQSEEACTVVASHGERRSLTHSADGASGMGMRAEGLLGGTNREAILAVRHATTRRVTAAGGITTAAEIDELDSLGVDAVVGMAIYTGKLDIGSP